MNTLIQAFDFEETPVRIHLRETEPWFVAADVCRVLDIANSRDAIGGLDEDEKTTVANPDSRPGEPGAKFFNLINESGLYALIFKSRKAEAKRFRKWVTGEVLPALRQQGAYALPGKPSGLELELAKLREMLLRSAAAVLDRSLDCGRAQQVANTAGRYLEAIKIEGDARGYEAMFGLRAGEAPGGVLPHREAGAGALQILPQRGLPGAEAGEPPLQGGEHTGAGALGGGEPGAIAAAPEAAPRTPDL